MSVSWGNAVEISGLPRGKFGVTPWKFLGYAVENLALAEALNLAKLLVYVLHCLIVNDEFPAADLAQKGHLRRESGNQHSALSFRLGKNHGKPIDQNGIRAQNSAEKPNY